MKNIHILPTDKPSRLIQAEDDELMLLNELYENTYNINKHIYITSDEEIKEGDYYYDNIVLQVRQWKSFMIYNNVQHFKIILTTDQDLIDDGVQAIDDDFLEWFVKNPSCEWVVVEKKMLCNYCGEENCDNLRCRGYIDSVWYEIIIPKEESETKCYCGHTTYCDCGVDVDFEIKQETYSKQQVLELMKQAFEAGFKKADTVEAGLEPKETEQEINWILLKFKNK